MAEQNTQLQRLQKAREKVEEFSREKSRLTGERGALQNQRQDFETKCQKDFTCKIDELPALVQQVKEEAETALVNSEIILGIREGVVTPAPVVVTPAPVVAQKATPVQTVKQTVSHAVGHDEDELP
jgi:hypothetical protein